MEVRTKNKTDPGVLKWPPLLKATLIRRYKRFMADVRLSNNHLVTAHCPNSGSMLGCSEPGRPVYLTRSSNPRRRLKYTWEMIQMPTSLVGINTLVPNRLVRASILSGKIPELMGYTEIQSEVRFGKASRVDLVLRRDEELCFLEIKNCTLVEDEVAFFPDAVTSRGLKHLIELQEEIKGGHRAVMFYLVQRMDAKAFSPADHIDPAYGAELRKALKAGLEILAYDVKINLETISLGAPLPVKL
ncbi:MAG TPA: DNA/RNA nuclease SfsA [Desulfobacterales bacterium]|nr:DNA/RNA nuclease SfsA [Desulfobacterales bacterium]